MERATMVFFVITFINVVLSTIKSILTVKASKGVAAIINAVAYGFYAMVVKQMATVSTETVIIATVACNLVGVYFSMWLLDRTAKDTLWKISLVPTEQEKLEVITNELIAADLGFNKYPMTTQYGDTFALDIFSKTTEESATIKRIIKNNGGVKYHITELNKTL